MKERILTGWNLTRIVYVIFGGIMIVQGIADKQWIGILFGAYFASMGVFRFGCAAGACYTPMTKLSKQKNAESKIEFEKIS